MTQPDAKQVTVAILAGGKGTRLGGVAKGLVLRAGEPLIAAGLKLGALAAGSIIVSADPAYDRFGVRRVEDVEPGRGAPGGLVTALLCSPTEWTLVVGCDMPFVTLEAARALLAAAGEAEVCCYTRDGALEPLLGLYRSSLGCAWRSRLAENPSLRSLLATAKVKAIAASDPRVLDSINTASQLEEVKS